MSEAPDYIQHAAAVHQAFSEQGMQVVTRHYDRAHDGDDLDRFYVLVTVAGHTYEQQFHQRAVWGTRYATVQTPGHDPAIAASLDAISAAVVSVVEASS
jgi:hypothetical protein